MATDGMWTMTEDGEFVLMEPYASQLREARMTATAAWTAALVNYLAERSGYDEGMSAMEIVEEFVLEALGGDL